MIHKMVQEDRKTEDREGSLLLRTPLIQEAIDIHDLDGDKVISKEEVQVIVRDLMNANILLNERKMWTTVLAALVVLLTACNIRTSYLTVRQSWGVKVSDDGELTSTKDDNPVKTVGEGVTVELDYSTPDGEGYRYTCIDMDDAAFLWHSVRNGIATSVAGDVEDGSHVGLELTFDGAVQNSSHIVLRTRNGDNFWVDLSRSCSTSHRRLGNAKDENSATALSAFERQLDRLNHRERESNEKSSGREADRPLIGKNSHRELATVARFGGVSRKKYKQAIQYLSSAARQNLAEELMNFNLATYKYRDDREHSRTNLGFIMEDVEPSFAAHSEEDVVDLYGYTSMAVATLQVQQETIEKLKKDVSLLKEQVMTMTDKSELQQYED